MKVSLFPGCVREQASRLLLWWFLIGVCFFGVFSAISLVHGALVTIDASVDITTTQHNGSSPTTVFISELVGYTFYVDSTNTCVYSKTTNGGDSWGSAVTVDSQADCIMVAVWYDRWTPGDETGTYIHVATIDTSDDDIFYTRLDTSDDTLSTKVNITSGSTYAGTLAAGANTTSITKGTDGALYASTLDTSDSIVVRCTTTCTTAGNWSENSPTFTALGDDHPILLPQLSGNIMMIQWDTSVDDVESKIFNGTSWDAGWTDIEANAADNTTYDAAFGAVVDRNTGDVYLAVVDDASTLGTDDDIKTYRYTGGSWSATGDVVTNSSCAGGTTCGLLSAKIAQDPSSGDLYVVYGARSTSGTVGTGNVYWKRSTDGMATWGSEQGPLDSTSDDVYGARINILGERLYATWYRATPDSLFGDTILLPTLNVGTTSTQNASLTIGGVNQHVGGSFVFTHTTSSTTITAVTITETGTVNAQTNLDNIRLYYDLDTSSPYDCASESYSGSESQFGSTDTDGFSTANGTSTFSGSLKVATSSVACFYTVLDVGSGATNGETLEIEITTPNTDVAVSYGVATPSVVRSLGGTTTLQKSVLTQTHFHWRNDNGSETTATSATGGNEDIALNTYPANGSRRLRLQVSNEGSLTSASTPYRLEYGVNATGCENIATWTDVGAVGGDWDMVNSGNLTDGSDTTNIAESTGGVTDENSNFESPNGGVKDTGSQTGGITLSSAEFVELEYSIQAQSGATAGTSYCFRVTDAGTPLDTYTEYARATIAADVLVSVYGTQTTTTPIPTTNFYVGGGFSLVEQTSSRNVTGITITETGTVNEQTNLDNIRLFYDLDTSSPYDCASESYSGSESQFGSTDTDGFSVTSTSTFSGSVGISTVATMCVYVVLDVTTSALNGDTIDIEISNATVDVIVDGGGSTSPTAPRALSGSTTLEAPLLTQTHFHWRNDDGSESAATSATDGVEDTALTGLTKNTTTRLRMQVSNEGLASSGSLQYTLEYGERISTCAAISTWIDVGASGGAFDMSDSSHLTDGSDTSNIAESTGGVTDENSNFETPNGGVKDTGSQTGGVTLTSTDFAEFEFSIEATDASTHGGTYCFRVTTGLSEPLYSYSVYPELTLQVARDFFIQRGNVTLGSGNASATITAGVDYTAPRSGSNAFIRITNTQHTGAGHNVGGGTQNADDITVYILNPENIETSINFTRFGTVNTTRISWEIVEYIGPVGGDNEIIVRTATTTTFTTTGLAATTTVTGVSNDNDVVLFVTGAANPDTAGTDFNTMLVTGLWSGATDEAVLTRGEASGDAVAVSWALVEFTGSNWNIQRIQHTYTAAGAEETKPMATVNSLSRTFIHTQKRAGTGLQGTDEFGHEVWLSDVDQVSFQLESGATTPSGQTSVAWVIENTQTTGTPMIVTRSNGTQSGGVEPLSTNINIGATLADLSTASIFTNNRNSGTGTTYPRPIMGVELISTTQYQLWLSDTGLVRTYRTEVVEWPTAVRTLTQNYYRFYVDDGGLDPADPYPAVGNLGENTSITVSDDPLSTGDRVRIRMSVTVRGSNLTASTTAFRLQYGERVTSCSAIASWFDVGDTASTTALWRGYNNAPVNGAALSGDPPTSGHLNLSVSDRAGSYVEENPSPGNPFKVFIGEDVEYDWVVENYTATSQTNYCFRMVESTGDVLDAYSFYPTILTAGFEVQTNNWRWYDDAGNTTPTSPLANENVAPTNIDFANDIKLRVTAEEIGGAAGSNVKFKIQFSEFSDFSSGVVDAVEIGSCTALSLWCYADGGGSDNATIPSSVLTDSDTLGTHNESGVSVSSFTHPALASTEYEFTLRHSGARVNVVYYFRLYDVGADEPIAPSGTYPSLTTAGASLSFSVSGLSSGTVTEGVTTDITTTSTGVPFGSLIANTELEGAQRLTISTNGTSGYRLFAFTRQGLLSGSTEISPVSGTNASPTAWSSGCLGVGCYGYHTGDDVLLGGSARFAPNDTYAQFSSTLQEIGFNSTPVSSDTIDIIYKTQITPEQPAGQYSSNVVYIIVPVF